MLNEREQTIHQAIEQAKKERAEAERLLAEQRASLGQAHKEAAEFVKKNQQEIEALRVELTARARKEADDMVASARRQIDEEKSKAVAELRSYVADLAIQAAGKLLRANLDERAQRALVEEYLAQLPKDRAA
jgi:F-type H+-transporting ATPase subunit b